MLQKERINYARYKLELFFQKEVSCCQQVKIQLPIYMYVILLAHDFAPSQGLSKLQESLIQHGHTVTSFFCFGKNISISDNTLKEHIRTADILVTGMSSSEFLTQEERRAAHIAFTEHTHFGFYSDTYENFNNPWFSLFRETASFLFVLNAQDAKEARRIFPSALIVPTGNPMWEKFEHPSLNKSKTRKKLGIVPEQHVILVPGTKDFVTNIQLFQSVIVAVSKMGHPVTLYLSLHPGDRNDPQKYKALATHGIQIHMPQTKMWSGRMLLPAADLVIASASTIDIEAAHQRIPVIDFFTTLSKKRLRGTTGSASWEPDQLGTATEIFENQDELSREIVWLLGKKGRETMQQKQKLVYPTSKYKGEATKRMMETLVHITKKTGAH